MKAKGISLGNRVRASSEKVLNPSVQGRWAGQLDDRPVLVLLAAGKGTRFGQSPKCAQLVQGIPLARHSVDAFQRLYESPVICVVGYRHEEVVVALGSDNLYVLSDDPTGGTAFAALEAFSVSLLEANDPLLVISMGDRIVPSVIFQKLMETHRAGVREADLTLLTAIYQPPRNRGKGRVVRGAKRTVEKIVEQRDIDALEDARLRNELNALSEGNCPLYAIRASRLKPLLAGLNNDNAQSQYYLTDIIEQIAATGGDIRTITTRPEEPEYDLLCSDVTRPADLGLLEGILASAGPSTVEERIGDIVARIFWDRPLGQVASIAAQLQELIERIEAEGLGFEGGRPVGIGIAGGRVRIAFMHPDMGRFFGPAWQMPIGAKDVTGREQIIVLIQESDDEKIHLYPTNPIFREKLNSLPAAEEFMFPGEEIADWYTYEGFGTKMAENLLLSLGYFTDEEIRHRKAKGLPLPPTSLWVGNSLRRPFCLVGNAIASMRTLRSGNLGSRVQTFLGRDGFRGLRVATTGDIPEGGFSSSSAVTVAAKNALNALYDLGIPPDTLVHLACQAEYGTGVRAGALDQATEQKGRTGQGTLISSNPRENFRVIGTYPVPAERFQVLFAYSVERDRTAWAWSSGFYAPSREAGKLTAAEFRKMTGKSAEIAAVLNRLPLDTDFYQVIESDLVQYGVLAQEQLEWVYGQLASLPLFVRKDELRGLLSSRREWYISELIRTENLTASLASEKADSTIESMLSGWRDPVWHLDNGQVEAIGMPLRAIVAYLFGEVAKNFFMIHNSGQWIDCVSASQRGDRCFEIDLDNMPDGGLLIQELDWEPGFAGPALLDKWLEEVRAVRFDFNQGLEDQSVTSEPLTPLHQMPGGSFFRGLALIDLAEAMLKKRFGDQAVAVRVNAAGQGDFFQIHVDTEAAQIKEVRHFLEKAFYGRFELKPKKPFVEPHPGGGAVGVRLSRFEELSRLIQKLKESQTAVKR